MIATSDGTGCNTGGATCTASYCDDSSNMTYYITADSYNIEDIYEMKRTFTRSSLYRKTYEVRKNLTFNINNIPFIIEEYIEKIYIKIRGMFPIFPIYYHRRTLFSKSGFIGRVAKRRKS